jgi:hypothetical protein
MDGTEQGCPALVRQPKAQYPCFRDRSHRCRCRSFVAAHRPSPRPLAPLLPLPVWAQRCCAPTRCRPTFSVQRSTFNPSRLSPLASPPRAIAPAADLGAALLRPYTLSSHVQRATFNLQPLTPLAPRLAPSRHCSRCRSGRSAAAPLHVVVPRSACNVQPSTPHASRPSPRPLAPLLPLPVWAQRCCAPTRCRPTFSVQRSTFNPSRLSPLASPPRAIAPAAGLGAALLRPYTLSSHVQRATFNLQPLTPLAPRLAPSRHCSRCRSGRSAAAPLHVVVPRSACNVQPSTPHASRPSPRPLAPLLPLPIWAQRCCAPTRCRPTFNVQRATFQPLTPLAPRLAPSRHCSRCRSGRSAAAPLHVVVPRSACNVQPSTPHASRPSPLASRLSPLAPPRTTVYRGRWHGTAPQVPHTAAIPPASDCAAGGGRTRRSGPSGATTTPALCHPHSR